MRDDVVANIVHADSGHCTEDGVHVNGDLGVDQEDPVQAVSDHNHGALLRSYVKMLSSAKDSPMQPPYWNGVHVDGGLGGIQDDLGSAVSAHHNWAL